MFRFEQSVFIERPIQEVWDFVSDFTNHPQFAPVHQAEWTSEGPPGVGATARTVSRILGQTIEMNNEITAWEPPRQFKTSSQRGSMKSQGQWRLAEQDNGTLLTFSGEADVSGIFKIAENLLGKQFNKQISTDLSSLKLLLEAGVAEGKDISA